MGHFIIQLPDGRKGEVRRGKIIKSTLTISKLFKKPFSKKERIGYIVRIDSLKENQKEYRLLKSREGLWLTDEIAGFGYNTADQMCVLIQETIDQYEKLPG